MLCLPHVTEKLWAGVWCSLAYCGVALLAAQARPALAQDAAAEAAFRKLAPGVITVIPPQVEEEETFSGPRPMVELLRSATDLEWTPKTLATSETLHAMAQDVIMRRTVWGLEFGFKPLRMIQADVRMPDGSISNQPVHYLVYYVKNNGGQLTPTRNEQTGTYTIEKTDGSLRFFPTFRLESHDTDADPNLDQVFPEVIERIRRREDPRRKFYDSVNISSVSIPVSSELEDHSVWGVATWVGVDPRSDFFSVFIQGLTNAYRWEDTEDGYQAGQPPMTGREFTYKTLQLNFWRPGDSVENREDEINYGIPNANQLPASKRREDILKRYGVQDRVDYLWVYR